MGGCDPPAFAGPNPDLGLPPLARASRGLCLRPRVRKITPERGYHVAPDRTVPLPGLGRAKLSDLVVPVEVLGEAVPNRVRAPPEEFIQHICVVFAERAVIAEPRLFN